MRETLPTKPFHTEEQLEGLGARRSVCLSPTGWEHPATTLLPGGGAMITLRAGVTGLQAHSRE